MIALMSSQEIDATLESEKAHEREIKLRGEFELVDISRKQNMLFNMQQSICRNSRCLIIICVDDVDCFVSVDFCTLLCSLKIGAICINDKY